MTEQTTDALEKSKEVHDTFNSFKKGYDAVVGVLNASPAANIIRAIAILLLGAAFFFVKSYIDKLKREYADKLTESQKRELEEYVRQIDRTSGDGDFSDENDL